MSLAVLNEGADVPEHQQQHHIEVSRSDGAQENSPVVLIEIPHP